MTPTGNSRHALRWDPGATVPTDISGGDSDSEAFAINIAGAAVGQGSSYAHPVYWAPGATTFTILPAGTFNSGTVWAINDAGVLAGQVLGNPTQWAAKWSPPYTSFTYLPFLPGKPVTQSTDINASGTVVGYVSLDASQTHHGFRYDPASDTVSELLGRPGVDPIHNVNILAKAVNGEGVSVGIAGPQYHEHAVMWLPGSTDAVDMNSLIDPASGWVLIDAWDINNAGQIIGQALSSNGSGFYVLTPVPEPTFLGSSLGMVLALTAARFRARGADAARCQTGRSGRGRCAPLS
jgi:probable HAF family extracellular repeat protein